MTKTERIERLSKQGLTTDAICQETGMQRAQVVAILGYIERRNHLRAIRQEHQGFRTRFDRDTQLLTRRQTRPSPAGGDR